MTAENADQIAKEINNTLESSLRFISIVKDKGASSNQKLFDSSNNGIFDELSNKLKTANATWVKISHSKSPTPMA